ncbi:MAG: hypothetical protein H0U55_11430, partial [Rubrobacteraceae bacterium]|nr:hypothetical protein [Rubrobacteraceae bacterium]
MMWVGRAMVFLVGLAVILGIIFGVLSKATAHSGSPGMFRLNHNNPVSALSTLTGTLAGSVLKVDNNGTGPALNLEVGSGQAPLKVNSNAGKATNLDADKLDGKDSTAFATGVSGKATDADKLDGLDSTNLLPDGDLPAGTTLRGRYDISGNTTGQGDNTLGGDGISYVYTLDSLPEGKIIHQGTTEPVAGCPGKPGSPEAEPGYLCVYEQARENIATDWPVFY